MRGFVGLVKKVGKRSRIKEKSKGLSFFATREKGRIYIKRGKRQ